MTISQVNFTRNIVDRLSLLLSMHGNSRPPRRLTNKLIQSLSFFAFMLTLLNDELNYIRCLGYLFVGYPIFNRQVKTMRGPNTFFYYKYRQKYFIFLKTLNIFKYYSLADRPNKIICS